MWVLPWTRLSFLSVLRYTLSMHEAINIDATLFCGQSFAWQKMGERYQAVLAGRPVSFTREELPALLERDDDVCAYFDCSFDYAKAEEELSLLDPYLRACIASYSSLRILRQDPWEVTISFILSQNNNIARIRGLYCRLSESYGTPLGNGFYTFPRPEQLSAVTEEELRSLGTGFRAPYIIDAIKKSRILDEIGALDDGEAQEALMRIDGVGVKVSSCILLFAYHRLRVFPIDVWVKRIMAERYPDTGSGVFAPYEGLAQQYLFHAYRSEHGRN